MAFGRLITFKCIFFPSNRVNTMVRKFDRKLFRAIYCLNAHLCPTGSFDRSDKFQIYVNRAYVEHLISELKRHAAP